MTRRFDRHGVRQHIYIPARSAIELGQNQPEGLKRTHFRHVNILKPWHRVLFTGKINALFKDVRDNIDLRKIDIVHAHSLFSDGALALRISKEYRIPYIVNVRNTDVNYFLKYRPDLRNLCWDILGQARRIVFVSPCYRDFLSQRLSRQLFERIESKISILPNGISDFWLQHPPSSFSRKSEALRIIYVGDFSSNKNIPNLLRASKLLSNSRRVSVTLVGSGGSGEGRVRSMLRSSDYSFVEWLGRVDDREKLLKVYRAHDILVMPSFRETFGIVYVEAMSQGLPVVYSQGQGIDGYFDDGQVGHNVNPHDPMDIRKKIESLFARLPDVQMACVAAAKQFNWEAIVSEYIKYYREAINV